MILSRLLTRASCVLALAAAASPVVAQPAHLLRDIVTGDDRFGGDANPGQLTPFGSKLAFAATEATIGYEVWISDAESHRTYTLGDICHGYCTDGPKMVGALGPTVFFLQRRAPSSERLLWASDGTVRGTRSVLEANVDEAFALLPSRLVFLVDGESGMELWRTDGTAGGTTKIASVGSGASEAVFLVSGNRATLLLSQPTTLDVWSTDGSAAGTRKLATLTPGLLPGDGQRAATATHAFFITTTSAGQELWASDGTVAGTRAVSSFAAPNPFATSQWLKPIGNHVYFIADDVTHGDELWRSDGTPAGTTRITDFGYVNPFDNPFSDGVVEELNGKVVFLATDGLNPTGLWTTTGSPSSTRPLSEVCGNRCEVYDDEPWLARVGNRLVFTAFSVSSFSTEVWSTDGTAAGSGPLVPCPPSCLSFARPAVLGDRLILVGGGGSELWSSDGTAAGTHEITHFDDADPFDVFFPGYGPEVAAAGGRIWFGAHQHPYGQELWSTAGTPETTELAGDINPGSGGSLPVSFAALGDRALFLAGRCADAGPEGYDAWTSDGGASTQRLSPFDSSCSGSIDPEQPIVTSGGFGYWWEGFGGLSLWRTDGTPGGTVLLRTFPDVSFPPLLLPIDGGVAFALDEIGRASCRERV